MTLVVGRVAGRRTAVVSDTLLTQNDTALPPTQGVIKTYMLPGGICVSFANSPELAIRDFTEFYRRYPAGGGYAEVVSFFEAASAASGNDYLVAFARYAKLVKIADGKRVASAAQTQWIGDQLAYERFREFEAKARNAPDAGRAINAVMFADEMEGSPASDLYSTMRHVLADRAVSNVGGFAYILSDRVDAYRQSAYCDMLFDWPESASDDFRLRHEDKIDFGASGENREFAVSQAAPSYMNLNAAVFYILAAKALFVFAGNEQDQLMRCSVLKGVAPTDIVDRLDTHVGHSWEWLIRVLSASPRATASRVRAMPQEKATTGAAFEIFCHVNTFPKLPVVVEWLRASLIKTASRI